MYTTQHKIGLLIPDWKIYQIIFKITLVIRNRYFTINIECSGRVSCGDLPKYPCLTEYMSTKCVCVHWQQAQIVSQPLQILIRLSVPFDPDSSLRTYSYAGANHY